MSQYSWSFTAPLPKLKASGENGILRFDAGDEVAEVILENNVIKSVRYTDARGSVLIPQSESKMITVGEGNHERDVHHFLYPSGPAPTMRLGLTVHKGEGCWSSLPHDFELHTEPDFEEVFFYLLEGGTQRAIQVGNGVWSDNSKVDSCWPVQDRTFSAIPMGYHPVVGEPKVNVSYVWAYLCKHARWEKVDF
jgi:5-deoxy-D-glucuronate isomerase